MLRAGGGRRWVVDEERGRASERQAQRRLGGVGSGQRRESSGVKEARSNSRGACSVKAERGARSTSAKGIQACTAGAGVWPTPSRSLGEGVGQRREEGSVGTAGRGRSSDDGGGGEAQARKGEEERGRCGSRLDGGERVQQATLERDGTDASTKWRRRTSAHGHGPLAGAEGWPWACVCMCMYVCLYVCMYAWMYVHVCRHAGSLACLPVWTHPPLVEA